jgi:transcription elongation factor Elf1
MKGPSDMSSDERDIQLAIDRVASGKSCPDCGHVAVTIVVAGYGACYCYQCGRRLETRLKWSILK